MQSRLTESLRRLQSHPSPADRLVHARALAELDDFLTWQSRWSDRRTQIARQLAAIDEQLSRLTRNNPQRPRLSLVVAPVGS
jgi:16S rRNA G527 N7-methylase RsmG